MDPNLIYVILGAFAAAFAIGSVGFADALILNAIWLHFLAPKIAVPLVVSCGFFMHIIPLYRLRRTLDFSRLPPFVICGLAGVPLGIWALAYVEAEALKFGLGLLLMCYAAWMIFAPNTSIGARGGKIADGLVGLVGGIMGGLAGLSGVFPTLWTGLRGWAKHTQRGTFQPFVLIMHVVSIAIFVINGMITTQVLGYLAWCIPAIIVGSWLGARVYPYFDEILFKRIIVGLIFLSALSLVF